MTTYYDIPQSAWLFRDQVVSTESLLISILSLYTPNIKAKWMHKGRLR